MGQEMADLGTPSAPPIMDIGNDENCFDVESGSSSHVAGPEPMDAGICASRNSEVLDKNEEGFTDKKIEVPETTNLGQRYNYLSY